MGWLKRLVGADEPESEGDPFASFDAMMREQDPEYDERRRVHYENVRLRQRRDFLRQQQENEKLKCEIAELEGRQ